jgi:superfamily II DNA/RNA helicase
MVVDEAHTLYKTTVDFLKKHPEIITVGLTATPFTKGLGRIFSNVVNVTTTDKLIALGWLSPLRAYAARAINMTGAATKFDGEWTDEEMQKRGVEIIGDVVRTWIQKTAENFSGPVKTLVFSATVDHGTEICRQFQEAGFNFQQVSYKGGNDKNRRELIEEFRRVKSDIVGLVSCEVLAKGFDVPDVKCGISCRPYRKSLSSHIQQIGRVMRQHEDKEFALWLDHSGNFLRFHSDTGEFFANGIENLTDGKLDAAVRKEPTEKERKQILCGSCGFIMLPGMKICPSCGWAKPIQNEIAHLVGDVHEIRLKSRASEKSPLNDFLQDRDRAWRQICDEAIRRKGDDVASAGRFAAAQYKNIYGVWPRMRLEDTTPEPCNPMLYRKIKSLVIAYAKRRAA